MHRTYAGVLGLLAFVVTVVRGVIDRHDAATTLPAACAALAAFAAAGAAAGAIAESLISESVEQKLRAEIAAHERAENHQNRSGRIE
jgi:hypothetical protein